MAIIRDYHIGFWLFRTGDDQKMRYFANIDKILFVMFTISLGWGKIDKTEVNVDFIGLLQSCNNQHRHKSHARTAFTQTRQY